MTMDDRPIFSWEDLVALLDRRRRIIVVVFLSGVATCAGLALLMQPKYQASAKIMATPERARITVSPDANSKPSVDTATDESLNGEVALLGSPALVRDAINALGVGEGDREAGWFDRGIQAINALLDVPSRLYRSVHGITPLTRLDRLALAVSNDLTTQTVPKSNLIQVTYEGDDPKWAAAFVNELVARYVEKRASLNQQIDARRFFEGQRQLLNDRLRQAQDDLENFRQREGVDSVSDQRTTLRKRASDQDEAMAGADTELAEATARANVLKTLTKKSPVVRSRIVELELQRSELLSQWAPTSVKVHDVDEQIAAAKRLLAEGAGVAGGSTGEASTTSQGLEVELGQTQAQIAAVKARKDTLRSQIESTRLLLAHLSQAASEYERLEQEVASARDTLLTYVKKEEEARFSNALDKSLIVNVTIAEAADVPAAPEPSKFPKILGLGIVFSLVASLAIAFLRDRLDPTVKTGAEAQRLTGLPLVLDVTH